MTFDAPKKYKAKCVGCFREIVETGWWTDEGAMCSECHTDWAEYTTARIKYRDALRKRKENVKD